MNLAFEEWLKGFNRVYEETTGRKLSLGEQMLMKAAWEGAAEKADLYKDAANSDVAWAASMIGKEIRGEK